LHHDFTVVTPSDEPPLAANIGRHCMGKMLAETHMRRSIFVYLHAFLAIHFAKPAACIRAAQ
jgi:hypothetical protein